MKHLITGLGGFVASHLARYLISQGEDVVGTIRWNEDLSRLEGLKVKTVPMDLIDLGSCIRCVSEVKPDYLYHLAAQSYVTDSLVNPIATMEVNVKGTLNLLEAIRLTNSDPIVYVASSSEVYGNVLPDQVPIKETNPFRPANPYAASKVAVDAYAYTYWRYFGLRIIRTRWFTHCGAGRTMQSFENSFARQIALIEAGKQEPVIKVGNLNSIRTIADVRDAVRGIYLAVQKCELGEVYNIGGDTTKSVGEVLEYLCSLSPCKDKMQVEVHPALLRKADVTLQIPDTSQFRKATGWKPEISFETTMQDLLSFWRHRVGVRHAHSL